MASEDKSGGVIEMVGHESLKFKAQNSKLKEITPQEIFYHKKTRTNGTNSGSIRADRRPVLAEY